MGMGSKVNGKETWSGSAGRLRRYESLSAIDLIGQWRGIRS